MDRKKIRKILKYSIEELIYLLDIENIDKMLMNNKEYYLIKGKNNSYMLDIYLTRLYLHIKLYDRDLKDYSIFNLPINSLLELRLLKSEFKMKWRLAFEYLIKNK